MARQLGRRAALKAIAASALISPRLARADDTSVPEQIVDTMNVLFGKHPGFRSAHAKGIVCEGEFTPAASAATLSKAPHLQGKPGRVTVRFSDSTGIPDIPDGVPDAGPRGMAVRFHLPGGGSTDLVANAFNGFAVATGEDFLAFLKAAAASGKDAPKPTPVEQFPGVAPQGDEGGQGAQAGPGQLRHRALFRRQRLRVHQRRGPVPLRGGAGSGRSGTGPRRW